MINIAGLDYRYGSQILFDEAGAKVKSGWTVGLIGPNGSGKTTLFRLITGEEHQEVGEISIPNGLRIGYFDQKVGEMGGCDVVEQCIRRSGRVSDLRRELAMLEEELSGAGESEDLDRVMAKYSDAQNEFQVIRCFHSENRPPYWVVAITRKPERFPNDRSWHHEKLRARHGDVE